MATQSEKPKAGAEEKGFRHEVEFAYLPIPRESLGNEPETMREKFIRKFHENPFVPIGVVATTVILSCGLWQMKKGNHAMSQKMMRFRIAGQGLTVAAVIGGVMFYKV